MLIVKTVTTYRVECDNRRCTNVFPEASHPGYSSTNELEQRLREDASWCVVGSWQWCPMHPPAARVDPKAPEHMNAVLVMGRFTSHCGFCGDPADVAEVRHLSIPNDWTKRGCAALWTRVTSDPDSRVTEKAIRDRRPDLVYLPAHP